MKSRLVNGIDSTGLLKALTVANQIITRHCHVVLRDQLVLKRCSWIEAHASKYR